MLPFAFLNLKFRSGYAALSGRGRASDVHCLINLTRAALWNDNGITSPQEHIVLLILSCQNILIADF